ncbi:MAG: hypothetical protein AB9869_11545 [Verrucomicrobiia bacterium]
MLNLRQDFPTAWQRFLDSTNPANGNVLELEMSRSLFAFRDDKKTVKINYVWLLARGKAGQNYTAVLNPPLAESQPPPALPPPVSNRFNLVQVNQYGRLHFGQKDVSAAKVTLDLADETNPPPKWQLKMTNPTDIEDMWLILGYEWE